MVERIRQLCKINNIAVSELERSLGFSNGLISKWDNSYPSIEKVAKVADYFDVSLDWLYGRDKDDLSPEAVIELQKYVEFLKIKYPK
jgi:transcriptional regulator with XRE-family HTH domain